MVHALGINSAGPTRPVGCARRFLLFVNELEQVIRNSGTCFMDPESTYCTLESILRFSKSLRIPDTSPSLLPWPFSLSLCVPLAAGFQARPSFALFILSSILLCSSPLSRPLLRSPVCCSALPSVAPLSRPSLPSQHISLFFQPWSRLSLCNTRWGRVATTSCRSESSNISLVVLGLTRDTARGWGGGGIGLSYISMLPSYAFENSLRVVVDSVLLARTWSRPEIFVQLRIQLRDVKYHETIMYMDTEVN